MRVDQAPPAGWYPDPEGGSRLRWWEGTDWSDRWRAPPVANFDDMQQALAAQLRDNYESVPAGAGIDPRQTQVIVDQVRHATRSEAERAAQMFGNQARQLRREIEPLISQYTNKFMKWIRRFAVIAIVFAVAWVAWQIFAQVSLFDWVGDRIDNITDNLNDESGGNYDPHGNDGADPRPHSIERGIR
jgi:hypothetical protein